MNEDAWNAAASWGREPRMNEIEALMWRSERHPQLSSAGVAMLLLDRTPDWDRLVAAHDWGTQLLPRFRERVVEPVWPIGPPAWLGDEHFDLDYHLQRTLLPGDGTTAALLDFAQRYGLAPLDRTRPLWQAMLVDGLEGGRAAYLLKLHHSITDGTGIIQLLALVQSRTREHTADKPVATELPGSSIDPVRLAIDELAEQARMLPGVPARAVRAGWDLLHNPAGAVSEAIRYTASARRVLGTRVPSSPLFAGRTGRIWRYGVLECGLAELKAAGMAAGGSVNDAFIAALLGGLRIYHEAHGVDVSTLPLAMPVSLRKADDPMGGNKFAGALFAAPVGIADSEERIATIRGAVLSVRSEPAIGSISLLAPIANRLPSIVGATAARFGTSADMAASNVPGIPHETFMAGAKVERVFAFGPLPGVAIMAAMNSHNGICCIGLNMDGSVIADHDALVHCFRAGLKEVLALGDSA
jgi:WS/DGAT/MGAT family acyltransferase